jgi:PEP-CTERM motif
MKKMMAMVALAAAMMVGSVASAASVDILVEDAGSGNWTVSVRTDIAVQAMVLQTSGFASRTFAPTANVSPLDSPFVNGGLQINSPAGQNLLGAGLPYTLVATLEGGTGATTIEDGELTFGYTVLDETGTPLAVGTLGDQTPGTFSLTVVGVVPEPASAVLLGLGLAGLAMLRRKAA